MITVEPRELDRLLNSCRVFCTLFDVEVGGAKHRVLPRDVQFHPVSDQPLHVDFLRVTAAPGSTSTCRSISSTRKRCPA